LLQNHCLGAILSKINPTRTGLGSKLVLRDEWLATDRRSHGKAYRIAVSSILQAACQAQAQNYSLSYQNAVISVMWWQN